MGTDDAVTELERRLSKPGSKAGRTQPTVLRQVATHADTDCAKPLDDVLEREAAERDRVASALEEEGRERE